MKLTQHGSFDESLESAMRDQLLFEFEEAELIMDFARFRRWLRRGSLRILLSACDAKAGRDDWI